MSRLIETYGGNPVHAPAMREVPLSLNVEALKFGGALFQGKFDVVIFLTGVGPRHPETCSGDQSRISLLATIFRNFTWMARRHGFGRKADTQAWRSASLARHVGRLP